MIKLQLLTAMRPGEVTAMRGCDLDTNEKLWLYKPGSHKTQHHGHDRVVYLGEQAKEIVRDFLKTNPQTFVFSPADAEDERREKLHAQRLREGTPINQGNKPGSNRARRPEVEGVPDWTNARNRQRRVGLVSVRDRSG
jgi:integrase